jgi:hypothetical protein
MNDLEYCINLPGSLQKSLQWNLSESFSYLLKRLRKACAGIFLFTIPWLKVPLSLPAPKRECGIFGPGMVKNRILNMGIKRTTPEHVGHPRLRLGWQFTRALDWPTLYLPCCVIYYFRLFRTKKFFFYSFKNIKN